MEQTERFDSLSTPCFILDIEDLKRSIRGYGKALQSNFKKWNIGYSVKTNSLPYSMAIAQKAGCLAEVVSYDEYNLARCCDFKVSEIIYNGPMKSKETFLEAVIGDAIVNIETHRELDWLKELPQDRIFKVGLRLNVNISKVSCEDADGENDNSRFGFSDETDEFKKAIKYIDELPNVKLAGLHIHRTAHSRSIRFYKNSIKYACETIKKYDLKIKYLDVGGGYFGIFANKPTYQDYSDAFYHVLNQYGLDDLQIIVEPGNALVASCFSFLSEVIDVKNVESNSWFITTDGSRNDIDPFFRKTSYITEILSDRVGDIVEEQNVSGCTCLEYDRLFTIKRKPLLRVGDKILYKNVGAYTMCLTPMFIRYIPNVYAWDGKEYTLVRSKWSAKEYLQKSIIK